MKISKLVVLILIIISVSACSKTYTCSCTETYTGLLDNYTNIKDSIITDIEKEEAIVICNKGDQTPQTLITETYAVECELN